MLASCDIIAFVATTDPARSKAFYGDVLGLRLMADEAFALVFDANGTMLRVSKVKDFPRAPFTILGWRVSDIAATVRALVGAGVAFVRVPGLPQDDLGIWTAEGGDRVAWFKDPDGNMLSVTQFHGDGQPT